MIDSSPYLSKCRDKNTSKTSSSEEDLNTKLDIAGKPQQEANGEKADAEAKAQEPETQAKSKKSEKEASDPNPAKEAKEVMEQRQLRSERPGTATIVAKAKEVKLQGEPNTEESKASIKGKSDVGPVSSSSDEGVVMVPLKKGEGQQTVTKEEIIPLCSDGKEGRKEDLSKRMRGHQDGKKSSSSSSQQQLPRLGGATQQQQQQQQQALNSTMPLPPVPPKQQQQRRQQHQSQDAPAKAVAPTGAGRRGSLGQSQHQQQDAEGIMQGKSVLPPLQSAGGRRTGSIRVL